MPMSLKANTGPETKSRTAGQQEVKSEVYRMAESEKPVHC
jgi:hypothetical protein